jgi:predicted DNA-binding protein
VEPGEASPKVEARVPPSLKSKPARHAEKPERATAEVVREALEEYLAHH